MTEKPYLIRKEVIDKKLYNPDYGDDRMCKCGHPYHRHFDAFEPEGEQAVGCKYCICFDFEEAIEIPSEEIELVEEGPEIKKIFTVTTIRHALAAGHRAVGFYYSFEDAEECITENIMDICEEGYYHFAVIEAVEEGIYTVPRQEFWYHWNRETNQYEKCEKPERFKQVVAWSLG